MNAFPVLFVLAPLAFAAIAGYSFWANGKRSKALAAYAASNRWTFVAEDDSLTARWHGTPFGEGDRRRARNVLSGTSRGRGFVGFEYQYDTETRTGTGAMLGSNLSTNRQRTTHHFFVTAVALPTWLPSLQVTPENLLTRAASAVGIGQGIQLESEDFNRRFRVTARDPKFASDVLTPRTMQGLLGATGGGSGEPAPAWRIEGTDVVSWGSGHLEPVALLARLAMLNGVVDGIPDFVWHDNGYDPHPGVQPAPPVEGSPS